MVIDSDRSTVIVNALVTLWAGLEESVTWIENVLGPSGPAGVPEITPVDGFKSNPCGNGPEANLQVYGVAPPLTATVCE